MATTQTTQITIECGDYSEDMALTEFMANNEEMDECDKARIEALEVGEVFTGGGGAAATYFVTRIA
jgi:hypothetical protein